MLDVGRGKTVTTEWVVKLLPRIVERELKEIPKQRLLHQETTRHSRTPVRPLRFGRLDGR